MQQTLRSGTLAQALPIALTAAFIITFDQVTKHLVRDSFALGEARFADWPVRFRYVENSGSAFGLFPNQTTVLIVASIVAMAFVVWMFRSTGISALPLRISLGMMLGGGTSNLADRIRFGSVTDFIDFRVWPIFNVADSSVVIGITVLVLFVFLKEMKPPKDGPAPS